MGVHECSSCEEDGDDEVLECRLPICVEFDEVEVAKLEVKFSTKTVRFSCGDNEVLVMVLADCGIELLPDSESDILSWVSLQVFCSNIGT